MGEIMSKITPEILAKQEGVTVDRIRQRWNENYAKGTFDRFAELSPEQVAALSRKKRGEKKRTQSKKRQSWSDPNGAKFAEGLKAFHAAYPPEENDLTDIRTPAHITVNQPAPAPEATPTPGRAKFELPTFHNVHRFLISALLFTVVVMHGLLIWYDCSVLWDTPGQIGGGTVFIVVFAALLLAADPTLPRTSGNALAFIFFVDCAAWKVHYEVFKTPVVDNIVTGSLCAFICAASFIALYLFRDSKLD